MEGKTGTDIYKSIFCPCVLFMFSHLLWPQAARMGTLIYSAGNRLREGQSLIPGGTAKKWRRWFLGPSFPPATMTSRIRNIFFFLVVVGVCLSVFSHYQSSFSLDFGVDHLLYLSASYNNIYLGTNMPLKRTVGFLEASDCQETIGHSEE